MSIISILLFLIIVGFLLWLINYYIPMQPPIKTIINVVIVIVIILWLLQTLGLISGFGHLHL